MKSIEKVFVILSALAALATCSCQFQAEDQVQDEARFEEADGGRYVESRVIMTYQ